MELTGKQRRYLRGLGHSLQPVVQLGKRGVEPSVVAAVDAALEQHELVKIKLGGETGDERDDVAKLLAEATKSSVAQILGKTVLLYRRHPKEPKISLPKASAQDAAAGASDDESDADNDE